MSLPTLKISRSLAGRVLHINTIPRPSNIGETREIQRLLSRFGEIEYFRSLRYDKIPAPNGALVIFKEISAAEKCMQQTPIRFQMWAETGVEEEQAQERERWDNSFASRIAPILSKGTVAQTTKGLPRPPTAPLLLPFASSAVEPKKEPRLFQIVVNPAQTNMRDHVEMGHHFDNFTLNQKRVPNDDMAKRLAVKGMADLDWRMAKRPMRVVKEQRERLEDSEFRHIPLRELYQKYKERNDEESKGAARQGS